MSRLSRITQKVFGTGGNVGTGGFGAAALGNTATELATSSSIATLMAATNWAAGWLGAVLGTSKFPAVEDMNALAYTVTTQLAYLFQQGIAEYDSGTTYYTNNVVMKPNTYQLYGSITNDNVGNPLTDTGNWQLLIDLSSVGNNVFTGGTTTGSANAQLIATTSPVSSSFTNGQSVVCTAGFTNTGSMTFGAGGEAAITVKKDSGFGLVNLVAGDVVLNDTIILTKNISASCWVLSAGFPFGTAAYKTASDNTQTGIASVNGSTVANNVLVAADPAGTVKDSGVAISSMSGVQSAFKNLKAVWASNTTATITADAIILQNSSGVPFKATSVNVTINSATSGAGGLDTGTLAASTWYYLYIIYNGTTVSGLMSASATAPTLPSGYTFLTGPISAAFTDGSKNFLGFVQYGRVWQYKVGSNLANLPILASGASGSPSAPTWVSVTVTTGVPTAVANRIRGVASSGAAGGTDAFIVAPNNSYGAQNSTSNPPPVSFNAASASNGQVSMTFDFILESSAIYWASASSSALLAVLGFELNI